ncbi:ABC transporter permease [Nitriliruptor alkaliphilus]|uniref:ABC transporter permease n=1 Tax=Nitriliruptor alkaliphilus TaxID=427918 RepID=UPI000AD52E1F|nr:ABC transporter permease [Nitriliruptor alkaliphilus]
MAGTTTETAPPAAVEERLRQVSPIKKLLTRPELGALVGVVIVWAFFAIVAWDNNFVSWSVTAAILNRAAPLGILAVAVALLMIAGEFDLSVGSAIGFSGMVVMILVTPEAMGGLGWGLWPAILAALVIMLVVGFFNGTLVILTRLPSFIITLGMLLILRGLAIAVPRVMTNRTQLSGLGQVEGYGLAHALFAKQIQLFGSAFRVSILWWVGLTALATWVLLRTRQGNWIFGAGGAADAARNIGVPVVRVKVALFMMTAVAAMLAMLVTVIPADGADSLRGTLREFEAIIAVVIGGTLLTGGYGSAVGAFLGALIFAMVQQGIIVTGVDGDWFQVFVGAVLVLAVIFNNYVRQKAMRG